VTFGLWQALARYGSIGAMAEYLSDRRHWFFCAAALAVWISTAWPVFESFEAGTTIRSTLVSPLWFVPFATFGAAVFGAIALQPRQDLQWMLAGVQLVSVLAMALILPWAGMSAFLVITAWQVGMIATPAKAFGWVAFQTLAIIGTLALSANPDLCWVITKSVTLQLLLAFTGQALRREAQSALALAETNRELRSAQAIIASTARDAERLRISRELHDAWGHELTALGLQLEIASHVTEPARVNDHVVKAKSLSSALLAKVRDVVAALREAERYDLKQALEALAESVPTPAIHVDIAPGVQVSPDAAHALIRCAQEAVTNAVRHSDAANLWLRVTADGDGVRLVARNDGQARRAAAAAPGNGLVGMRERIEYLGGRLAVRMEAGIGFTVEAWLPSGTPKAA
jgi:signal transduction histidine kinase